MTGAIRLAALLGFLQAEERVDDAEYERSYAAVVRACESAERRKKEDPAGALKILEEQVLSRLPRRFETVLSVRYSKGATVGAEKERHAFFPYRLAGELALAAGDPERAIPYLEKSPSSGALLADARRALEEKRKKPAPAPALQKPGANVSLLIEKHDYAGALEALRRDRERLGPDHDRLLAEARAAALRLQKERTSAVADVLPRFAEERFREEHLAPCLAACGRVPGELETEELRWVRRLGEWTRTRDPAELERLAAAAAKFDADFHVVARHAQQARLDEIRRLVGAAREAPRAERPRILAEIETAERAFNALASAVEFKDLRDDLPRLKEGIPINEKLLDEARQGAAAVSAIRVLADQLDLLWRSPTRARLSVEDQKDLALYLGIYRCYALFLDGRTIDEVAQDPRVAEVLRASPALPKGVSPKVAEVVRRIR
jgi:hypothetical protein